MLQAPMVDIQEPGRLQVEANIRMGDFRFCRSMVILLDQETGEDMTVQTDLQQIYSKSGRLPEFTMIAGTRQQKYPR